MSDGSFNEKFKAWGRTHSHLPFAFCLLTFAFALCFSPVALRAQGCAMCYTSASAAQSAAKQALANGTLILLVPPLVFFALITVVLFRYRNRYRDDPDVRNSESALRVPSSLDTRLSTEISQEGGVRIADELRYLESDRALVATNDGPPTTDKQYQRS